MIVIRSRNKKSEMIIFDQISLMGVKMFSRKKMIYKQAKKK